MVKLLLLILTTITLIYGMAEKGKVHLDSKPYPLQNANKPNTSVFAMNLMSIVTTINEIMTTVVTILSNITKDALVFTLNNAVVVLLSSLLTLSLCNYTKICSKINSLSPFRQIQFTVKYFATPQRVMQIADFVHDAIKKYSDMQKASK